MATELVDIRVSATERMERVNPKSDSLKGEPVKIIVGDSNKVIYHVYEGVLRNKSAFFEAALKKEWKEGTQRIVKLPEEEPSVFCDFMQWLYTGRVPCIESLYHVEHEGYMQLVKLWLLADHLIVANLQDSLVNAIVAASREPFADRYPSAAVVEIVYQRTAVGSRLRKLMLDMYTRHVDIDWHIDNLNREFAIDLLKALASNRTTTDEAEPEFSQLFKGVPCRYHVHYDNKPCDGGADKA
ncbi:hypothetical protein LTR10_005564 [Elasticomyces elasticus]|nr:hypothetical protein LTR10_005564 [Elasticomyces elasticus]KAK4976301.1 hypothetical protein LTR42_003930 [Elasticomyces elasticus]